MIISAETIKTKEPFRDLFPIDPKVLAAVAENMQEFGYDVSAPIVLWRQEDVVLDGHTRLKAAQQIGLEEVHVNYKDFVSIEDALEYAIHNQRDRRNMTEADLLRCVDALDELKERGGDRRSEEAKSNPTPVGIEKNQSATATAKTIGTNRGKVEKARTVLQAPTQKQAVLSGQKTINKAYNDVQAERRVQKEADPKTVNGTSKFNRTNDNIEWAKWTWNPVTGCEHGCPYCYARDIANRFYKEGFKPTFHPDRLNAPNNTKIPKKDETEPGIRNVFVCSMADLFGDWVPQEWIDSVLEVVRNTPQWTYLFLTKNPKRYVGIDWPKNAWVGATIDKQERVIETLNAFEVMESNGNRPKVTFISFEPLLEDIDLLPRMAEPASGVDWIIIGGQSVSGGNQPPKQPEWEWVEHLFETARSENVPVYFKPNLTIRPKEYPHGGRHIVHLEDPF